MFFVFSLQDQLVTTNMPRACMVFLAADWLRYHVMSVCHAGTAAVTCKSDAACRDKTSGSVSAIADIRKNARAFWLCSAACAVHSKQGKVAQ